MKKALAVAVLVLSLSVRGSAQFGLIGGLGSIGQYAQLAEMITILSAQLGQQQQIDNNTGKAAATDAKYLQLATELSAAISAAKYGGLRTLPWALTGLLQADFYGHASPLINTMNGAGNAPSSYLYATYPVTPDNPVYYASEGPNQSWREASNYAVLQDADAINAASFQSISDANQQIPVSLTAVNNLATDSLSSGFVSSNPQLSEVALGQKTSIATAMNAQTGLENQQLLSRILAELTVLVTMKRNDLADKLATDALVHQQAVQAQTSASGLAAALSGFNW